MWWWVLSVAVATLIVATTAKQTYARFVRFRKWPSPSGTLPVLGNALAMAPALLRYMMREAKGQRGSSFLVWPGGSSPMAVIANAKAAKEVLGSVNSFPKGRDYMEIFGCVFGDGLVTSSGPTHARARRLLGRFFVRATLEKEAEAIADTVDTCLEAFLTVDDAPMDMQELFHTATLQIFGVSMLGVDMFRLGTPDCPLLGRNATAADDDGKLLRARRELYAFAHTTTTTTRASSSQQQLKEDMFLEPGEALRFLNNTVSSGSNVVGVHMVFGIPMSRAFPHVRRLETRRRQFASTLQTIIDARRTALRRGDVRDDVLTALVRAADEGDESGLPNLTDEQIGHQLVTLLSAGHDTTAFLCCYSAFLLAKHPDVQAALREELCSNDEKFVFATSLLKRVFQETLRLYPTIPCVTRCAAKDVKLPRYGDDSRDETLLVPRGTKVMVPFFILNRQPGVWGDDADDFKPDRWLALNGDTPSDGLMHPKLGFLPFAYGSRTCIGYNLSLVEGKIIFQHLLQSYDLSPVPNFKPRIKAGISLTVENPHGIRVHFSKRPLR